MLRTELKIDLLVPNVEDDHHSAAAGQQQDYKERGTSRLKGAETKVSTSSGIPRFFVLLLSKQYAFQTLLSLHIVCDTFHKSI